MKRLVAIAIFALLPGAAHAGPGSPTGGPSKRRQASVGGEPVRETAEGRLAQGKQAYGKGDYESAVRIVRPLVYPEVLLSTEDEISAHRILAMSYFFEREVNLAEREFEALLQLKDDFALDAVVDPPAALQFLENIRRRNHERIESIQAQKKLEEAERQHEAEVKRREEEDRIRASVKEVTIERTVEKHWRAICLVPFGMGQFQNGQRAKGWSLFSLELFFGAASIGLWGAQYIKYVLPQKQLGASDQAANTYLSYSIIAAGGAFWVAVAAGVIDALVHYVPEVVTERRVDAGPTRPIGTRPTLAPYVSAGGGGLVLQGAF